NATSGIFGAGSGGTAGWRPAPCSTTGLPLPGGGASATIGWSRLRLPADGTVVPSGASAWSVFVDSEGAAMRRASRALAFSDPDRPLAPRADRALRPPRGAGLLPPPRVLHRDGAPRDRPHAVPPARAAGGPPAPHGRRPHAGRRDLARFALRRRRGPLSRGARARARPGRHHRAPPHDPEDAAPHRGYGAGRGADAGGPRGVARR